MDFLTKSHVQYFNKYYIKSIAQSILSFSKEIGLLCTNNLIINLPQEAKAFVQNLCSFCKNFITCLLQFIENKRQMCVLCLFSSLQKCIHLYLRRIALLYKQKMQFTVQANEILYQLYILSLQISNFRIRFYMSNYTARFNRIYEIIRIVVYRCSLLLTLINFVLIRESPESHMWL